MAAGDVGWGTNLGCSAWVCYPQRWDAVGRHAHPGGTTDADAKGTFDARSSSDAGSTCDARGIDAGGTPDAGSTSDAKGTDVADAPATPAPIGEHGVGRDGPHSAADYDSRDDARNGYTISAYA